MQQILHHVSQFPLDLTERIAKSLSENIKPVLIITAGGSSIDHIVVALELMQNWPKEHLQRIHITLLDERWDVVPNHPKSNWPPLLKKYQELTGTSLAKLGVSLHPVLSSGVALVETVKQQAKLVSSFLGEANIAVCIGLGSDGHVAGILPYMPDSPVDFSADDFVGYAVTAENIDINNPFLDRDIKFRISPGLDLLQHLIKSSIFAGVVATGTEKSEPLQKLLGNDDMLTPKFPAVVLRKWLHDHRLSIYTDKANQALLKYRAELFLRRGQNV